MKSCNQKLCDPTVLADPAVYAELMKEHKSITPIVEKYREYKHAEDAEAEALALLEESGLEKELRELAEQELEQAKKDIARTSDELKILLLPRDPNDEKNVIMEIRGGAGGEEAALFSAVLFRMYSMYAERHGWQTELLNVNETELGGYKEISFMISGDGAYSRLKYESGVHRVQRVPETETQGRVHTSTATVAVLPEAGRRRNRDQSKGFADRYLPFQRRGRPAHQQDVVRHPHHAFAHGHGGGMPGRAQPVQK